MIKSASEVLRNERVPVFERVTLQITDFGQQFIEACVAEHSMRTDGEALREIGSTDSKAREDLLKLTVERYLASVPSGFTLAVSSLAPLYLGLTAKDFQEAFWSLSREGVIIFVDQIGGAKDIGPETTFKYIGSL